MEVFERFLQRTFPGKTRFSIEGLDVLVPVLDEVIGEAAEAEIPNILIGMAHRWRLNVLAHFLKEPYQQILREARLQDEDVCYMGDDIVDLPVLTRVGLAVGVASGHKLLHRHVQYVTEQPGGMGAVREVIELILSAQGKWDAVLKHYLR